MGSATPAPCQHTSLREGSLTAQTCPAATAARHTAPSVGGIAWTVSELPQHL